MATPPTAGRASVFRDKRGGDRVQGNLTREGKAAFLEARRRLAKLSKRKLSAVSDADVIEYLARGEEETTRILEG